MGDFYFDGGRLLGECKKKEEKRKKGGEKRGLVKKKRRGGGKFKEGGGGGGGGGGGEMGGGGGGEGREGRERKGRRGEEGKICDKGIQYVMRTDPGGKDIKRGKDKDGDGKGDLQNWSARAAQIASKYCKDPNYGKGQRKRKFTL